MSHDFSKTLGVSLKTLGVLDETWDEIWESFFVHKINPVLTGQSKAVGHLLEPRLAV